MLLVYHRQFLFFLHVPSDPSVGILLDGHVLLGHKAQTFMRANNFVR